MEFGKHNSRRRDREYMRETEGRECGILRIVPANVYCLRDVQEMVKKEMCEKGRRGRRDSELF